MTLREIVLDTETTGLDPKSGHRLVEIGCLELRNHIATGESFHVYLNPGRDMPEEAFRVHGLSAEFLAGHRTFGEEVDAFLAFIGDDPLVIHNASFDMGFLNAELAMLGRPTLPMDRAVDTVRMARKRFPGASASLDALCNRFGIDNSARTKHGALLDSELLAEVYLELLGGRQAGLVLQVEEEAGMAGATGTVARPPRPHAPSAAEAAAHLAFLRDKIPNALWLRDPAAAGEG
ncbi:MAG: DNA polymerase III subunit epsilon [Sneathiellaceae bacterium]